MKKTTFFIIILSLIVTCSPKNEIEDGPESENLSETFSAEEIANLQAIIVDELTGGSSKTWFFGGATFISPTGDIDVTNLKNVVDDEFIFHKIDDTEENQSRGILEWRPGISVPENATTVEELAQGSYQEPVTIEFEVGTPSEGKRTVPNEIRITFDESTLSDKAGKKLTGSKQAGWRWKYWYGNVNTIEEYIARSLSPLFFPPEDCKGRVGFDLNRWYMTPAARDEEFLKLCAREKLPEDYTNDLEADLIFEEEFSFFSNSINHWSTMTGSEINNSIYIATSEESSIENGIRPERIIKYNISSKELKETLFFQRADLDKASHIIDNSLWIVGPRYINQYDLDLNNEPKSYDFVEENKRYFYTQTAVYNNEIIIVGGYTWNDPNGNGNGSWSKDNPEGIYKWELESSNLIKIGEENIGHQDPVVVNDKLYFLGGNNKTNELYNFSSNSFERFNTLTTVPLARHSYPYGNKVYLASRISEDQDKPVLGIYHINSKVFSEFSTNLTRPNLENIYGIVVLNNRMYILYGEPESNTIVNWQVLSAPL